MNYFVFFVFIRERFVIGRGERGLSLKGNFEFLNFVFQNLLVQS